ncbi:MAG: DUF4838 domain-containing protein [Bacteroidota bacterium]|nr:DUF4838 domain-containing protein [Bacteroidota bacterium]MDP4251774.1 DUF4838 domain-containing protein [Bacteroidota bacterium]
MKRLIFLLTLVFFVTITKAQQFTLVSQGKSNARIIIPEKAGVVEIQAAKVFQDYIQRISGALIPIATDNTKPLAGEILIGRVSRPELKDVPFGKLGKDGLYIRNTGKRLVIAGGTGKGVLYGVYTFLEEYMGCRKYSSKVSYVPSRKTIVLNSIHDIQIPAFTYREDFYPDAYDPEYMDWHKLDSHFGGHDSGNEWGYWVHTANQFVSAGEFGKTHPEYFSFYQGRRHPEADPSGSPEAQLCWTNPDILDIVCKRLKSAIGENPVPQYWSVSQNDNTNYCRCPDCSRLDSIHAAPGARMYSTHRDSYSATGMGSLLPFINQVADRFPDKTISTLAYQYTRVPPVGIVPRKNVNIMLCNIESPRNVPIEIGDTAFCHDLNGWARLTGNIIIWDYVVQFRNLVSPFPNLRTLKPNLQYLHSKGVQAIFEEANPEKGGEFAELRAYLIAKLLWNPDLDVNRLMDDFLSGYYGHASKMIRAYIDLLHDQMEKSGVKLGIYQTPVEEKETFLSDSLIRIYTELFNQAEKAVAGSPEILRRVKTARLPLEYAILEIARDEKTGKRGAFMSADDHSLRPKPEIVKMLYDFVYLCISTNVSHLREGSVTPQQYLENYNKFLEENTTGGSGMTSSTRKP